MNYTFFFISMAGFFIAGFCAVFVIARNPESRLNRSFFFFAAAVTLYNFTDAMLNIARSRGTAEFCLYFNTFFWLMYLPILLYFCLLFSGLIETMSGKILLLFVYISAIIMIYPSAFTHWIFDSVRLTHFGFHAGIGKYYLALGAYSFIVVMCQAIILGYTWMNSKEKRKKDMAFILFAGLLSVFAVGTTFDIILPLFGHYVHSSVPATTSLFILIFAYVMARFGFMLVSPAQLAKDILATMPDMMIFIDRNRYINLLNNKVLDELGYTKGELINRPIKDIFSKDIDPESFYEVIRQKGSIRDERPILMKKSGELIPVTMDATLSRDQFGDEIGCVIIFRDISETEKLLALQKQTSQQLAAQVTELEKLNRLTMDREDKIIELKNKIKELEGRLNNS